jgi:hypothetical protein
LEQCLAGGKVSGLSVGGCCQWVVPCLGPVRREGCIHGHAGAKDLVRADLADIRPQALQVVFHLAGNHNTLLIEEVRVLPPKPCIDPQPDRHGPELDHQAIEQLVLQLGPNVFGQGEVFAPEVFRQKLLNISSSTPGAAEVEPVRLLGREGTEDETALEADRVVCACPHQRVVGDDVGRGGMTGDLDRCQRLQRRVGSNDDRHPGLLLHQPDHLLCC